MRRFLDYTVMFLATLRMRKGYGVLLCLVTLCIATLLYQRGMFVLHATQWSVPFLASGDPIGGGGGIVNGL
ncbi:MAG TPA: hypothetical protein VFV38_46385 [Ktedonobacteraceae bacterium]|nr:hypothetical protein [Ktedonobacteraceae bacterium]